jgi:hypothetical protein
VTRADEADRVVLALTKALKDMGVDLGLLVTENDALRAEVDRLKAQIAEYESS